MAEACALSQSDKRDEWRNPINRYLGWHEPPAPASEFIVRPSPRKSDPMVPSQFMWDLAGKLCYCTHFSGKWQSRADYRLRDGRWLLCRSDVTGTPRAAPEFAIVDALGDDAHYFSYEDMDWTRCQRP